MADEAILRWRVGYPISMVCANEVGIEKGAMLMLSGGQVYRVGSSALPRVAGIASGEKIASDGNTVIGVYNLQGNIFYVTVSGSVSSGDTVTLVGGYLTPCNFVQKAPQNVSGAVTLGTMLEDGTNGQQKLMVMNIR